MKPRSAPRDEAGAGWLRTLRTAARIPPAQLAARARFLWLRRRYARAPERPIDAARRAASGARERSPLPRPAVELVAPEGPDAVAERAAQFARGRFTYLGRTLEFAGDVDWLPAGQSPLFQYQLQYLTCVRDLALAGRADAARALYLSWRAAHGARWQRAAWHPYPVSLRLVNLCHAASALGGFDALGATALLDVATHAAFLLDHEEHDVRGNHLFENARALAHASCFLDGPLAVRCGERARAILAAEIPEQVPADGGHFELSALYHTIVLHGLLQIVDLFGDDDALVRDVLAPAVARMRRFLALVLCPDDDLPLLGDAVRGFGPPPLALLGGERDAPASRPRFTALADSGLHVWRGLRTFAVLDAGPVCPDYLPAHGQADSLTVEVWVDGARVVADPGVHDYSGPHRAWGRSSRAHSTVTLDDRDNAEVYGSFRVGGRPTLESVIVQGEGVTAVLRPFGVDARIARTVRWGAQPGALLRIVDRVTAPPGATVRARLHLDPGVTPTLSSDRRSVRVDTAKGRVRITAAHPLTTEAGSVSEHFGELRESVVLVQELTPAVGADGVREGEFTLGPDVTPDGGEAAP